MNLAFLNQKYKAKRTNKIFSTGKSTIEVVNCKNDKLSHKHLIHINKFVRKDSNTDNNLRLEKVGGNRFVCFVRVM